MGLSGRQVKQRIGNDPRNLSWADDAARFGSSYLSKFGWDSGKGLGVKGEGRTVHIKVAQKLDMMGIGAAHQKDPNGIAWKQNQDYENLLKRLNEAKGTGEEEQVGVVVDGFVKPTGNVDEKNGSGEPSRLDKEGRKKKREEKDKKERGKEKGASGEKEKKKKRKRDEDVEEIDKKTKKKRKRNEKPTPEHDLSTEPTELEPTSPDTTSTIGQKTTRVVPRHRSHRARHIAAKSIGSKSALAILEILGIAPTPSLASSATSPGTQTPQEGKLTSIYDDNDDTPDIDKITTSTKSLQDYFKEKMLKLKGVADSVAVTNRQLNAVEVDYDDVPRGGLGSRPKTVLHGGDTPRIGLSKISALMSSSFMAATSSTSMFGMTKTEGPSGKDGDSSEAERGEDEEERQRRKKGKKARKVEKRERKEERRRRNAESSVDSY